MHDSESLFVSEDGWFLPTPLTTGPWRPDAMHGGPPCALIARSIEQELADNELVGRINIDLESPVPLVPLAIGVSRNQISRRVAKLQVTLSTSDRQVASAQALLLRAEPFDLSEVTPEAAPALADSGLAVRGPDPFHDAPVVYHRDAVEHRFERGGFGRPGPTTLWVRLLCPLVAGEEAGGLAHLFAAADFGSAVSQSLPIDSPVALINVDVSVALARMPIGPWIRIESTWPMLNEAGLGLAVTRLADVDGHLGVGTHSQIAHSRRPR